VCTRGSNRAPACGPSTSPLDVMALRLSAWLLLSDLLSGCFPIRYVTQPGASGTVVDSTSSAPVVGATVTLSIERGAKLPNACVNSGSNGSFTMPAQHGWMIYIVPMDLFGFGGTLNVDAPGYQHAALPYYAPGTGSGVIPFDIKLTRSP
jgi:hypothetical protein